MTIEQNVILYIYGYHDKYITEAIYNNETGRWNALYGGGRFC